MPKFGESSVVPRSMQFKVNFLTHESFDKIVKPEICDILVPTSEYRNPWYTDENRAKDLNENMKLQLIKVNKVRKQNELNKKIVEELVEYLNTYHLPNNIKIIFAKKEDICIFV